MQLQAFASLTKEKQIDTIKSKGVLLFIRQQPGLDIILYQIDGFYAEVYFNSQKNNSVQIKSFNETERLETYLKDINLSEISHLL